MIIINVKLYTFFGIFSNLNFIKLWQISILVIQFLNECCKLIN